MVDVSVQHGSPSLVVKNKCGSPVLVSLFLKKNVVQTNVFKINFKKGNTFPDIVVAAFSLGSSSFLFDCQEESKATSVSLSGWVIFSLHNTVVLFLATGRLFATVLMFYRS